MTILWQADEKPLICHRSFKTGRSLDFLSVCSVQSARGAIVDALTLKLRAFAFLDVGLRRWRGRGGLGAFDFLLAGILFTNCRPRGVEMPRRVQYRKTSAQPISKFLEFSPGLCVVVLHNQERRSCAESRQRPIFTLTAS